MSCKILYPTMLYILQIVLPTKIKHMRPHKHSGMKHQTIHVWGAADEGGVAAEAGA